MAVKRGGSRPIERWLPLAYFAMAALLAIAVLPSVLRPFAQQPNQTAELSPDAPPNNNPQAIISSLRAAQTATAGTDVSKPPTNAPLAGPGADAPTTPPTILAAHRGQCYGNPPRQTESPYAPPCAPACIGNGGATYQGVTATQVNVLMWHPLPNNQTSYEGPVPTSPPPANNGNSETAQDRTYRILQQWFNDHYDLCGRRLQIYTMKPTPGPGEEQSLKDGVDKQADSAPGGIAAATIVAIPGSLAGCEEAVRRKIITWCTQAPLSWFAERQPLAWSYYMDSTKIMQMSAEYICKKLAGKNASFGGSDVSGSPRKFGVIYYNNGAYSENADTLEKALHQCHVSLDDKIGVDTYDPNAAQTVSNAVLKMHQDGVTTVIPVVDFVVNDQFTQSAKAQNWFPEYFVTGFAALDFNQLGGLSQQDEWAHAFGISTLEMNHNFQERVCTRAYHSIDPSTQPHLETCVYLFPQLEQVLGGMQLAGKTINPQTVRSGLFGLGYRFYTNPVWAVGGGYGPGDLTYTDDATEIWWDPKAPNTETTNASTAGSGAYKYVRNGKRFKPGDIPTEDPLVFRDGVTTPQ